MLEAKENQGQKAEMVSLESLASLTGFPVEMIKTELFNDVDLKNEEISLEALRERMMSYIDETMLKE